MCKKATPLVSVIMPSYNAECFILEAINSVRQQTFKNWELIIADDCSTDATTSLVETIIKQDSRVKLFKLNVNSGAAVARNTALAKAEGRYVAFLDSDDLWLPTKLQEQLHFMQQNTMGFSFTAYHTIHEDGTPNNTIYVPTKLSYTQYLQNTIIGCLTVMIDRSIVGDFRMPLLRKRQDMATWLSILRQGYTAYGLNEPLAKYRLVQGSISNNKFKAARGVWRVYREVEGLPIHKSLFYFLGYAFNAVLKRLRNRV